MMRNVFCFLLILGLLGLTGCLDDTTVVNLDKTGAGTVVNTTYMNKAAMEMMAGMMGAMGGKDGKAKNANPLMDDPEKLKAKAAEMGEGVKFVSIKEVKKPDGSLGAEVVYSFTDINKLVIDTDPNMPSGGPGDMMKPEGAGAKKKSGVTFKFAKGSPAKLAIAMPKAEPSPVKPGEKPAPPEDIPADQLKEMQQMFDGFRFRLIVKVDGEIDKSNATYVEKDPKSGKKQVVTLMDMDVSSLLKDEKTLKKAAAMGEIKDMAEAKEKLKDFPGLRFETNEKVDVEFK